MQRERDARRPFLFRLASCAPAALPPPSAGRRCSVWGALLAAHPAAWCRVPTTLAEERQPRSLSCVLSSPSSLRNPGRGFLPFLCLPVLQLCSGAPTEHCWEMGWSPLPAGDARGSAKGVPVGVTGYFQRDTARLSPSHGPYKVTVAS